MSEHARKYLSMAHLTTPDVQLNRSTSYTSVANSDTTYHSFHDIELYEPAGPPEPVQVRPPAWKYEAFAPTPMRRQDSGYESIPSDSKSSGSRMSTRRTSTTSSRSSNTIRPRTRPSIHRASRSSQGPSRPPSRPRSQQYHTFTYYHFPDPEECTDGDDDDDDEACHGVEPAQYPPPPATTHYWTSDSTRRMEYAAIDAASQGVKGWIMRHVVPDCFIPKNSRRLRFDDDTGSVRRYRLELEDMPEKEGKSRKRMSWFGR